MTREREREGEEKKGGRMREREERRKGVHRIVKEAGRKVIRGDEVAPERSSSFFLAFFFFFVFFVFLLCFFAW